MAVTSQINISINTQNAIRSIADLDNEIGGVISTVTDLELTIQALSEELRATEIGTERFKELQGALVEAQGKMKDFELSIESLDAEQRAAEFGSFAAGIGDIATGALALTQAMGLGTEQSEKFVESIVGGFAIANSFRGGIEGIISAQKLLKNSTLATTVATEGGTIAMKAFNVVVKANPIGILVTALLAGVAAFAAWGSSADDGAKSAEEFAEKQKKIKEEQDKANQSIAEQSGEFVGLILQLKATNKGSEERLKLINKINDQYGTTLKNLDDEEAFQKELNIAVDEYINLQRIKFRIGKNQEEINQLLEIQLATETQILKIEKGIEENMKSTNRTRGEVLRGNSDWSKSLRTLNGELDETNKKLEELGISTLDLRTEENGLTNDGKKYVKQTNENTKATKELVKKKRELVDVDKEILRITKEQEQQEQEQQQKILDELEKEIALEERIATEKMTALNTSMLNELTATEGNQEEQQQIRERYNRLAITAEIEKVKRLIAIRKAYGQDVADLELQLSQLLLSQQDSYLEDTEATFEERLSAIAGIANQIISQVSGLASAIGESIRQQEENARLQREQGYEDEAAQYEAMLASNLISREEYDSKLTNLDQKREMEERAARRRAFQEQKKMNIANAIMAGAQAVLSGLATQPLLPLGVIMAGIAAATSAIQINTIKQQQFTAARGGVVPGQPSMTDSVPSLLAPGEMVINSNSSSMFGGLLSEINQLGGGIPLTPNVPTKTTTGGNEEVYQENMKSQRVYVLESDITEKQRRVTRIEDIARF